jgi:hypothetical protein
MEQLQALAGKFSVTELPGPLDEQAGGFMDTAAIMQHLDLVVTSDTAMAHLAGALGVRVGWRWRNQPTGGGCRIVRTAPGIQRCGCSDSKLMEGGPRFSSGWPGKLPAAPVSLEKDPDTFYFFLARPLEPVIVFFFAKLLTDPAQEASETPFELRRPVIKLRSRDAHAPSFQDHHNAAFFPSPFPGLKAKTAPRGQEGINFSHLGHSIARNRYAGPLARLRPPGVITSGAAHNRFHFWDGHAPLDLPAIV